MKDVFPKVQKFYLIRIIQDVYNYIILLPTVTEIILYIFYCELNKLIHHVNGIFHGVNCYFIAFYILKVSLCFPNKLSKETLIKAKGVSV